MTWPGEGLDRAESTFRSQLGDNPIFGQSFPMPVFDLEDEPGFWVVTVLLGLVLAYNVWEVVALQRGPSGPGLTADSVDGAQPAPLPSTNSAAPGWTQGPPPQGTRPADAWPVATQSPLSPQGPPPGYPPGKRQPPQQPPSAPGYPPRRT